METQTILSEDEAAQKCVVQKQTMRSWRSRGRGPAYLKLAGRIRYRLADIEAFIESCRVVPGRKARTKSAA